MKALRQVAAGALCFSNLFLTLPQANAIRTGTQLSQTLDASLLQRVSLAQQEMQANALALAVYDVGSSLKEQIVNNVKDVVLQFYKELVKSFQPTFDETCHRVAEEAAGIPGPYPENDGIYDPAASALAQIEESLSAKETCDTSSAVSFKPTGAITASFLEERGFWDTLKQGTSMLAGPVLAQLKKALGEKLAKMLKKEVGPQLQAEVSQALNGACVRAIQDVESEVGHPDVYQGTPGNGQYGEPFSQVSQEGR